MASHIFCPSCGSKNEFSNGRAPNFCSGCGNNLTSLAAFGGPVTPARKPANAASAPSGKDWDIDAEISGDQQGRGNDSGFSKADVEVDSVPVEMVNGRDGRTFRPVVAGRQTVGDFFRHPIPPEEARQPMTAKIKGASAGAKKAFDSYKDEAGGNGLKRQEIG